MFKKLDLGNYQWLNYNQVHASTLSFGAGLRSLGIEPKSIIAIYAETRAEWMMSCLGAFSQVSKSKIKHRIMVSVNGDREKTKSYVFIHVHNNRFVTQ